MSLSTAYLALSANIRDVTTDTSPGAVTLYVDEIRRMPNTVERLDLLEQLVRQLAGLISLSNARTLQ